jgi:hypothetical protein
MEATERPLNGSARYMDGCCADRGRPHTSAFGVANPAGDLAVMPWFPNHARNHSTQKAVQTVRYKSHALEMAIAVC